MKILSQYLKRDNYWFVTSHIRPIEDSLQPHQRYVSANVQVSPQDPLDLGLQTVHGLMNPSRIRLNSVKDQIILPASVNFVKPILQIIIDANQFIHLALDGLQTLGKHAKFLLKHPVCTL